MGNYELKERINHVCTLLNIKYPIFQGAMAWISDYHLVSAVSQGGGLGVLASGGLSTEELQYQLEALRQNTTKPYAVNVALKDEKIDGIIQCIVDNKVPIVITGAGNPERYMPVLKKAGCIVMPVVSSVALAKRVARYGADIIIAEGCESGGHIGTTTTMCIVPQIVDAVSIPVVAAGGIADGRGMAAALSLGASAVQLGTRFLVTEECCANTVYKEKIIEAKDISTRVLNETQTTRDSIRALKSPLSNQYLREELENPKGCKLDGLLVGALRKASLEGNEDEGLYMSGQCAGLIHGEEKVLDVINDIWNMARKILDI